MIVAWPPTGTNNVWYKLLSDPKFYATNSTKISNIIVVAVLSTTQMWMV